MLYPSCPRVIWELSTLLILNRVIGHESNPEIGDQLHKLAHAGGIETLTLSDDDVQRHRLRLVTDKGTDCAIALARSEHLANGVVLLLELDRAIVVRTEEPQFLDLRPKDASAALELGYFAGNMHWVVRFGDGVLRIVLSGPAEDYLDRLAPMFEDDRISRCES